MGNSSSDAIKLVQYDLRWPSMAKAEAAQLYQTLESLHVEIEHIGSTSIPGLDAKPIIDLMVGVGSLDDARATVHPLESLRYSYWRDNPHKEHFFFVKGLPQLGGAGRTHHVHVVKRDSDFWTMKILFRDFLRNHPDDALMYVKLKSELAIKFRDDRDGYTNGKTDFVHAILAKAGFRKTNQP